MRVLVYEPKFVGHFLGFAAASAKAFAETGCDVTLAVSTHAAGSSPAEIKLASLPDSVQVQFACDVPKVYRKWTNARLEAAGLEWALEKLAADWLVVPSADFLVTGLATRPGLLSRLKQLPGYDLVLHNCRPAYPQVGLREWPSVWFDRFAVSLCSTGNLHTVDEYAVSPDAAGKAAWWGRPIRFLPHFYDGGLRDVDPHAARRRLGLAENGVWVGSVGDLGRRKGTELLIDSFAQLDPSSGIRLALFGAMSATAKETLAGHKPLVDEGRIVVRDEFVPEEVFRDFFPAMDVVWTGYPRQVGMASTLLFAADARRPVVAIDYGGVAWTVREYGLGVVAPRDPSAIAGAIREACHVSRPDGGAERYLDRNNTLRFNEAITAAIRSRIAEVTS